jgi:dihydroflavonol-4-reductase
MRVLITGGTGFVGSHSVEALIDAGHDVRLMVRAPERIAPALGPLGVRTPEYVIGDVTDPTAVRRALDGCDAVLHAANVYAFSRRRAHEMASVNPRSTELVLGTAHELGLDPIVHVSSYVALLPPPDSQPLTAASPIGHPAGPYGRSKAASEGIARQLQHDGAPVVITYPGTVWGPNDPHLGETAQVAQMILHGRMPVLPPGPMAVVDVRDVAAAHAAVIQPRLGPRRFLLVAEDVPFPELVGLIRRATGRRLPARPLPYPLARRLVGNRKSVPGAIEGPWFVLQRARTDSAETERVLGIHPRSAEKSIIDTLGWLYESGHLDRRRAGKVAHSRAAA